MVVLTCNRLEGLAGRDVLVQYQAQVHTVESLRPLADRLTASLFYIELMALPSFSSIPDNVRVRLRCRLPPGPPLMSLLARLVARRALVYSQGDEAGQRVDPLITSTALSSCRKGKGFSKILEMKATSLTTKLGIRVGLGAGHQENISNCPYELRQLIHDQGLDCPFGRSDHVVFNNAEAYGWDEVVEEEINELRTTLDGVILSWSRVSQ